MGNDNQLQTLEALKFYHDPDAEEIFAKTDLQLKDGMHFQERDHQFAQYYFLRKNAKSLEAYYRQYYRLNFCSGGEGADRYYFLDFNGQDRGNIDGDHRYFLRAEYVIAGFLIHKIIYNDRNLELTSVEKLLSIIITDYEEFMEDIYRLLAKLRKSNATTFGNDKVKDVVLDALKEFKKLGWIVMEDDFFDVMPSFSRLGKVYGDYINDLESFIKS